MKNISFLAVCIAVITTIFSCSKQQDLYPATAPQHAAQVNNKVAGSNSESIAGTFDQQHAVIKGFPVNPNSLSGGGDDDKPKVMHRVLNPGFGPVQNAAVTMTNSTDSLWLLTDSAGECTFKLPRLGIWGLRINLGEACLLDTSVNIVDSFSVRTINLY